MRKSFSLLLLLVACAAWAEETEQTAVRVSGRVNAGVSTQLNTDQDQMSLQYTTNDPRLGTNSGNLYFSDVDDVSQNVHAVYGAELNVDMHQNHTLQLVLEGANDNEHAMGSRVERLTDKDGNLLSGVSGQYNHPDERSCELTAGLDYTYRLRRPGSSLSMGYRYRWEKENGGVEQQICNMSGLAMFENILEQAVRCHTHHAHLDYTLPVAKGHLLDFGLAYDRRDLSVHTEQDWDNVRVLDADYRHLTQYGGVHARYRVKWGPLEAMARLEYRATRMQNRWLNDVLPTANIRYRIDSVHSLTGFYTIMLIRPDVQHLDTTHISDVYTTSYGNDKVVGVHVHNVALTYAMHLPKVDMSAQVRYLNASDGFNAIWMERDGRRIYTWGNEGVRHAVGITPAVDARLSATTKLHAEATVMWDKRVAAAINLVNANWGVRTNMRLVQQLFAGKQQVDGLKMNLVARGDYAYHNTLDVYSYAGHGGSVGADLQLAIKKVLTIDMGYTCLFKPDVHIIQGAYVGTMAYRPGATHIASLQVAYAF